MNRFPFEDITFILHRYCNLHCEYCPLDHFPKALDPMVMPNILGEVIDQCHGKDIFVTFFGGEPLLNLKAIQYLSDWMKDHEAVLRGSGCFFHFKLVTNGTLLTDEAITLLSTFQQEGISDIVLNISIDGPEGTQKKQRPARKGDYSFSTLESHIHAAIQAHIPCELGMVIAFDNRTTLSDVVYLYETFHQPIFLMPVDLSYDFLSSNAYDATVFIAYLQHLRTSLLGLLSHPMAKRMVRNFQKDPIHGFVNLKYPPIGPTIDPSGKIYITRDFLFQMDPLSAFEPIGDISSLSTWDMIAYFGQLHTMESLTDFGIHTYFGRTYDLNMQIGNEFLKYVQLADRLR